MPVLQILFSIFIELLYHLLILVKYVIEHIICSDKVHIAFLFS